MSQKIDSLLLKIKFTVIKKTLIKYLLITIVFSLFSQNSIGLHGNAGVSILHGGHYNSSTNNLRPVGDQPALFLVTQYKFNEVLMEKYKVRVIILSSITQIA